MNTPERRRWPRVLRALGTGTATFVLFVASFLGSVVLHLDEPVTRRVARVQLNALLGDILPGAIVLGRIERLSLRGVAVDRVTILEPRGVEVIDAGDLEASLRPGPLLLGALRGELDLQIPRAHLGAARVSLARPGGELGLRTAFVKEEDDEATSDDGPPPPVRVRIEEASVDAATVTHLPELGRAHAESIVGAVDVRGSTVDVTVTRAIARATRAPIRAVVTVAGALRVQDGDLVGHARTMGRVAGGSWLAEGSVDGTSWSARAKARIAGDQLGELVDGLEPGGRFVVAVAAEGDATSFDTEVQVDQHDAGDAPVRSIDVSGRVVLPELGATLDARFRHVDIGQLVDGPTTDLSGHGAVRLVADAPAASVSLDLDATTVAGRAIPATSIRADGDLEGGWIDLDLGDAGRALLTLERRADAVHAEIDLDAIRLGAAPVDVPLRGRIDGTAEGTISLPGLRPRVGSWDLRGRSLAVADARVDRVWLRGEATPEYLDARLRGDAVRWGDRSLGDVKARAQGPLLQPRVTVRARDGQDFERLRARAHADLERLALRGVHATVERAGVEVTANAPHVDLGEPAVPEVTVEGLGQDALLSFHSRPGGFDATLDAERVALARLARLLPFDLAALDGQARVRAELHKRGPRFRGSLELAAPGLRYGTWPQADLYAGARLEDGELVAAAGLRLPEIGEITVATLPVELGRLDPTSPQAWLDATGRVGIQASANAAELVALARERGRPDLSLDVEGQGWVRGLVAREEDDAAPSAQVTWQLEGHGDGTGELSSDGTVEVAGPNDDVSVEVRLYDEAGPLAWFDAEATLPWQRWWATRFAPPEGWLASLREANVQAWLHTAWRDLDGLPVDVPAEGGRVRIPRAFMQGTLEDPHLGLEVQVEGYAPPTGLRHPLDLQGDLAWHDDRAHAALTVGRRERLTASAHLDASPLALLQGEANWEASAEIEAKGVPLALFRGAVDAGVRGRVHGTVTVEGLGTEGPAASADLALRGLTIQDVRLPEATMHAEAEDGAMNLGLDLRATGEGELHLEAETDTPWRALLPATDATEQARVTLDAHAFPLGAAQPWTRALIPELEGKLDADVEVSVGPETRYEGTLSVRDGRFHVASLGEELFDTQAELHFEKGELQLDRFRAKSLDGIVNATGAAKWDGFDFEAAALATQIEEPIPVVVEGRRYGSLEGEVQATAVPKNGGLKLTIKVPDALVRLPNQLPTGVQRLEEAEKIRIGTRHDGEVVDVALGPRGEEPREGMPIYVGLELGEVEVRRGEMLRAFLSAGPEVEITDETRMRGRVVITGGTLELQGREFELRRSLVNFTGRPPDNPEVVATAAWTAPDGTEVLAKYRGPLLSGSLELSSNPSLPESQILSLLAFGSTDGAVAAQDQGSSTAGQAIGVGGSVAAQGLNAAIDDLTSLDIRAGVAQREGGTATELEVRVARSVSVQLGHILGLGGRVAPTAERNYAAIEWIFAHRWSLEAKVGDQGGTSLDLLWRHRY